MLSGIAITVFSCLLLAYWFRYTCLLILNTRPADDRSEAFFRANRMGLPRVRKALEARPNGEMLDRLHNALAADFSLITGLLSHSIHFEFDAASVEMRMVLLDYRILRAVFFFARKLGRNSLAQAALSEMASAAAWLAHTAGRRSANLAIE